MNLETATRRRSGVTWTARWLCAVLSLCAGADAALGGPQRVVSMNVCTDQLVALLLPRERIASLSYIAADPRTSAIAANVAGIHLNRGTAEEIVALDPDLVVTGQYGLRPTVAMLRRLGFAVLEMPMATAVAEIPANLLRLGEALDERDRALAAVAEIEARLARLTVVSDAPRPLFVNYDANGWTTGQTGLLADIVHRAGLATPGDRLGFASSTRLSLEALLRVRADVVDLGYPWDDPPALASELWHHPAMRAVVERAHVVDIPDSAWLCGTPHTLDALATLRRARDELLGPSVARAR